MCGGEVPPCLWEELEGAVGEVCRARQGPGRAVPAASQRPGPAPRGSGDSLDLDLDSCHDDSLGPSPVEELAEMEAGGESSGGDRSQELSSCLSLLARAAAGPRDTSRQCRVLHLLRTSLDCYCHYSSAVLGLVLPTVRTLVTAESLKLETVDEMVSLLKRIAAATVTKTRY